VTRSTSSLWRSEWSREAATATRSARQASDHAGGRRQRRKDSQPELEAAVLSIPFVCHRRHWGPTRLRVPCASARSPRSRVVPCSPAPARGILPPLERPARRWRPLRAPATRVQREWDERGSTHQRPRGPDGKRGVGRWAASAERCRRTSCDVLRAACASNVRASRARFASSVSSRRRCTLAPAS
jgi:hypothetical protein